jgi:hypothetical protein
MKNICHEFLQKSLLEPLTKVLDSKVFKHYLCLISISIIN